MAAAPLLVRERRPPQGPPSALVELVEALVHPSARCGGRRDASALRKCDRTEVRARRGMGGVMKYVACSKRLERLELPARHRLYLVS